MEKMGEAKAWGGVDSEDTSCADSGHQVLPVRDSVDEDARRNETVAARRAAWGLLHRVSGGEGERLVRAKAEFDRILTEIRRGIENVEYTQRSIEHDYQLHKRRFLDSLASRDGHVVYLPGGNIHIPSVGMRYAA